MGALTGLIEHMDWMSMLLFLMSGAACLICLTVHELAHGLAAYRLGDPTAKLNGRLALAALGTGSLVLRFWSGSRAGAYLLLFLCQLAVLSVGLGLFNLIPLPPLDGSKVLDVLLPERWYHLVLRYERYLMLAVVLLAWSGAFGGPLTAAMELVLRELCRVVQFPFALVEYYFF